MASAAIDDGNLEHESPYTENRRKENENIIAREVKSAMNELVATRWRLWSKKWWTTLYLRSYIQQKVASDQSFGTSFSRTFWT